MRVLAAMSGGVDSAVAAARAVDAGHDVTGVHLALSSNPASFRTGARGCCTLEDARDARRAADVIGIPFYVWDLAERFRADVVDDFVAEYAAGRTPNPCLRCNEKIKFSAVLDRALALGFDAVVHRPLRPRRGRRARCTVRSTRPRTSPTCSACSRRGSSGTRCSRSATRPRTRCAREAGRRGLAVADKPDSHDICFIADGDTAGFLQRAARCRARARSSTATARGLGEHDGAYAFTVGQRRGPALGTPAPDGKPRYVLDVVAGRPHGDRRVGRGPRRRRGWSASGRCGAARRPPCPPTASPRCARTATRWPRLPGARATACVVELARPLRGVAPGQAVVLYDGDQVLGSATVDATRRAERTPPASTGPARASQQLRGWRRPLVTVGR